MPSGTFNLRGLTLAEPTLSRLIATLRTTEFSRMTLRMGEERIQLVRDSADPPAPAAVEADHANDGAADRVHRSRHMVKAPAPGIVAVETQPGHRVVREGTVATVRVNRVTCPAESRVDGVVADVYVTDGDFVEYGQDLLSVDQGP